MKIEICFDPAVSRDGMGEVIALKRKSSPMNFRKWLDCRDISSTSLPIMPKALRVSELLGASGIAKDSPAGRRAYGAYMDLRHRSMVLKKSGAGEKMERERMERGWVHGGKEFRERLRERLLEQGKHPEELEQKRELG